VLRDFPRQSAGAARALFLLADLATDEGRDAAARDAFASMARRFPTSSLAPLARFRAAIIAYAAAHYRTAAGELDALVERYPHSTEALAARYWAGRAYDRLRDTARAREHWRDVMASEPLSYYAMMSARRLSVPGWAPVPAKDSVTIGPALAEAVERAELLEALGMTAEEELEYDRIAETAGRAPDSLLAAADALRERGEVSRAIVLARRALAASAPRDTRLFRSLYPLAYADVIQAEATAQDVDPALVAALIHQESNFNPHATSRAGARGLMQLLPSVGAAVARAHGLAGYERVLLYQPDVNIRLGVVHLDAMLDQYPHVVYALAAYNAGGSPVRRWRQKRGTDDPELFIERIPYDETRDYVRILLRNQATYEALYDW
jgi:soluble lytic murein transglycosylase